MKKLWISLVVGVFVMASGAVFAGDECDKYKTSYDQTYCYAKLFVESDKELNAVYNELKGKLKDDMKKKLAETEREWMKYRTKTCEEEPGTITLDCNYKINRERTEYLRDRLRECKTGNCREDMITGKSWK